MASEANPDATPRVYLDAAAAAPLHPIAKQALLAAVADGWADPTKLYFEGRRAAQLLDAARATMADCLGVRADEVTFCASGSRAAEFAIAGTLAARARVGDVVVRSAVEHSAVLRVAGDHAVSVPVDRWGRVDPVAFGSAVAGPRVALAALQSANHEVGTAQPVPVIAQACVAAGVPLYVDAAQSVGRIPVPSGWGLLSASAVKWGGPAGVGVLVVRKGVRWQRPWPIERVDPDAVDIPLAVAAAASLRAVLTSAPSEAARQSALVARIRNRVAAEVPDVEIVGDPTDRLPHLVTFSCLYVDGEAMLHALDRYGFAVSSGSSCTAATLRPSHVLEAMGVLSHGNVRVSLHAGVTESDVDRFLDVLPGIVADLRAESGAGDL